MQDEEERRNHCYDYLMDPSLLQALSCGDQVSNGLRLVEEHEIKITPMFDSVFDEIVFSDRSNVIGRLYLGPLSATKNEDSLTHHDIRVVVSMTKVRIEKFEGIEYHRFELEDRPEADLLSLLPDVVMVILDALKVGSVLLHCNMGVSRSGAVAVAVKGAVDRLSPAEALQQVKVCRPCVHPNQGFKEQLVTYFSSLND
jgi:hypothetical protein